MSREPCSSHCTHRFGASPAAARRPGNGRSTANQAWMASEPPSCRRGPRDTQSVGPRFSPTAQLRAGSASQTPAPIWGAQASRVQTHTLTPGLCAGQARLWGAVAQAGEERDPPPFCRQLRPAHPTELGPAPTAFKDSCLPLCPRWGALGVSAPWCSAAPPLPFFSIASTSFTSSGGATSGGLNCSCKSGRGDPGGERRERRGQPELSPPQTLCSGAKPRHNQRCSQRQRPRARKAAAPAARLQPRERCTEATGNPQTGPETALVEPSLAWSLPDPNEARTGGSLRSPQRPSASPCGPRHAGQAAQGLPALLELGPGPGAAQSWWRSAARSSLAVVSCD